MYIEKQQNRMQIKMKLNSGSETQARKHQIKKMFHCHCVAYRACTVMCVRSLDVYW